MATLYLILVLASAALLVVRLTFQNIDAFEEWWARRKRRNQRLRQKTSTASPARPQLNAISMLMILHDAAALPKSRRGATLKDSAIAIFGLSSLQARDLIELAEQTEIAPANRERYLKEAANCLRDSCDAKTTSRVLQELTQISLLAGRYHVRECARLVAIVDRYSAEVRKA